MGVPKDFKVYNMESMPTFVKREEALRKMDAASQYGAKPLPYSPSEKLGSSLVKWQNGKPYKLEELKVLSNADNTFEVEIPPRDFVHLIVR